MYLIMKTAIFIAIAALTLIAGADKPQSTPAIKAQRTYEDSVRAADGQQRQALIVAQDEYLTKLKEASDSALEANDLKAANEIEAARKAIARKKPFVLPTYQLAIDAQRTHEDSVQATNAQHLVALKQAEEVYQKELQAALDSAIAAKDLTEANRIDAVMQLMPQKIDTRNDTGKLVFSRTTNSIGMTFVLVPAGEFMMGSPPSEPGRRADEILHRVRLTKSFEMGIYEVTQAHYEHVVGHNPSRFKGLDNPVEKVSWADAVEFCRLLSAFPAEQAAGRSYRLPTEAEWEYACRAGTTTAYSFGEDESQLGLYAWFDKNSNKSTHPVGRKKPNAWGLHDMHGNVKEICSDFYESDYHQKIVSVDPQGPSAGSAVVCKGGCWSRSDLNAHPALRGYITPTDNSLDILGFRVVLSSAGPQRCVARNSFWRHLTEGAGHGKRLYAV
jgi:formylglycine-generating enzyme required for sulfatase activity